MSKKTYFKYIEEHANPTTPTAPALICEKCGKQSIYRAEKCTNTDCGIIFFSGAVPNDFPDRCPECDHSEIEEIREKRRLSGWYSQREQETKPKSVYGLWEEDEKRLRTKPATEQNFKKLRRK